MSLPSEELVRDAVLAGLRKLGDDVPRVVLYFLQTERGVALEDLAGDPARLGDALKAVFGEAGARIVIENILDEAGKHPSHPSRYHRFMEGLASYKESLSLA
jgi:hypothetical protein